MQYSSNILAVTTQRYEPTLIAGAATTTRRQWGGETANTSCLHVPRSRGRTLEAGVHATGRGAAKGRFKVVHLWDIDNKVYHLGNIPTNRYYCGKQRAHNHIAVFPRQQGACSATKQKSSSACLEEQRTVRDGHTPRAFDFPREASLTQHIKRPQLKLY